MCGRAILVSAVYQLREAFGLTEVPEGLVARYNIAPSEPIALIRTPHRLELLRWGLVLPSSPAPKINIRSESVSNNPATRDLVRARRCLIVVDGFYEWSHSSSSTTKQPYLLQFPDKQPFALAGIWTTSTTKEGEVIDSCAILTCDARPPVRELHDRMPVILPANDYERWLDPAARVSDLLTPHETALTSYAVSTYVNSPANDDARCIEPGTVAQGSLF